MKILNTTMAVAVSAFVSMYASADPMVITDVSQLDFEGDFVYAVNFNGSGNQAIGDASFTNVYANGANSPAGVSVSGFNVNGAWGGASNLGSSAENNALENVMRSIIWSHGLNPGQIDMDVESGMDYRLQLLFSEGCCNNRHFDVVAEDQLNDEILGSAVGGSTWVSSSSQGYAYSLDFTASDSIFDVDFFRHAPGDTNYHISGFTLERMRSVPEPASLGMIGLGLLAFLFTRRRLSN